MPQAQPADTLAGCMNQQINLEQPGNITGIRDQLAGISYGSKSKHRRSGDGEE